MTVESDHAIALVLVSFPFLSASEKLRVITQAIRSKLSIGIGITGKSNCLVKPMVVLVLGCFMPSCLRFPGYQIRHAFGLFLPFFSSKFHQKSDKCVHSVDTEMAFSPFHDLLAMAEKRKVDWCCW